MIKKIIAFQIIFIVLTIVAGCVLLRANMEDIKDQKYFRKSYSINKTVSEIEKILYDYSKKCRPLPTFVVDPSTKKNAYITWVVYITSTPTIRGLMDFQEKDNGITIINAYWYYQVDVKLSDKIVLIINNPSKCQD